MPSVAIAERPPPLGEPGTPAVRVMGTVEITGWRELTERQAVLHELCAYLALHPERGFTTEQLAIPLESTAKTVRNNLSRLRRALGADHLPDATLTAGYRLVGVATDWGRFCELTGRAGDADGEETDRLLAEALSHVRGVPFTGVPERHYGWVFSEPLATDITAAIVDAAHRLAQRRLAAGDPPTAVAAARRGILASPTELSLWSDLVTATVASGERSYVRRILADAKRVLDAEDAAELAALAERLRTTPVGEGGRPPEVSTP
ncbi:MAG: AfsR/SARP family transcriptional regulator [Acidimicrobiales bacterium]